MENALQLVGNGLNEGQVAVLSQRTPAHMIFKKEGKGGKEMLYIPHNHVTELLNTAFGHIWSFETEFMPVLSTKNEMVVKGRLTLYTATGMKIVKEQFGQCEIPYSKKTGNPGMTPGDAVKGAASDALRKCASQVGIGLDMYGEHALDRRKYPYAVPPEYAPPAPPAPEPEPTPVYQAPEPPPPEPAKISQKVKNLILKLSASHVWTKEERQKATDFCTATPPKSMDSGLKMIERMKTIINERKAEEKAAKVKAPETFPCDICKKKKVTAETGRFWFEAGVEHIVCNECFTAKLIETPEEDRAEKEDEAEYFKRVAKAEEAARKEAEEALEIELDEEDIKDEEFEDMTVEAEVCN